MMTVCFVAFVISALAAIVCYLIGEG